nr:thiamin pyrophosphokinase 1-like [Onthophagus taurus]
MDGIDESNWDPCNLLLSPGENDKYAVLVLNTPITLIFNTEQVLNLWNKALIRITVDGGTDKWLDWLKQNDLHQNTIKNIDLITGDMDSIKPETLEAFKESSTIIINTYDQEETDFTKAILELKSISCKLNLDIEYVVAFNSVCGRFDQVLGNVNTLYKINRLWPEIRILIVTNSITWLLSVGQHRIQIPSNLKKSQEWCALIPVGNKTFLTTSGLKWNLDNSPLEFGYLVSTSNTYSTKEENVVVLTDQPIVWSMGIKNLLV